MASLNKVLLIGNLGKDPELRYTQDGVAILSFPLATGEVFTEKSGEKVERTTWHNITVWGKIAETLANYLSKGKQVFIEGKIRNSSYDDKDGIKRYKTEVIASNVVMLGSRDTANLPPDKEPPSAHTDNKSSGEGFEQADAGPDNNYDQSNKKYTAKTLSNGSQQAERLLKRNNNVSSPAEGSRFNDEDHQGTEEDDVPF
jgi:single-strand DNA-binding protein